MEHGAADDQRDELHSTPILLIACEKINVECASSLLKAGANPNAMDKRGNAELHHVALRGNTELVRLLMDCCANESIKIDEM
jgi:ankyrin repeat protein